MDKAARTAPGADQGLAAFAAQIAELTRRLEAKLDQAVGHRLSAIQVTLSEIKANMTATTARTSTNATRNDAATAKDAPLPLQVTSIDAKNEASTSTDHGGQDRKRRRLEGDENHAAPTIPSHEQEEELRKNLVVSSLTRMVLERIIPCKDLQHWDRPKILRLFNSVAMEQHAARWLKFMDGCQTQDWYCARAIAGTPIGYTVRPVGNGGKCSNSCCTIDCVQLARFETEEGPGSKYYQARVVERFTPPLRNYAEGSEGSGVSHPVG